MLISSQFNSLEDSFNEQYDLVISNFAFSELSRKLQNIAMNKIIKKSNKGFMIINSIISMKHTIFIQKKSFFLNCQIQNFYQKYQTQV